LAPASGRPSARVIRLVVEEEEALRLFRYEVRFADVVGVPEEDGPTKSVVFVPVVAKPVDPWTHRLELLQIALAAYCQSAV